jgi:hypothetical protein
MTNCQRLKALIDGQLNTRSFYVGSDNNQGQESQKCARVQKLLEP